MDCVEPGGVWHCPVVVLYSCPCGQVSGWKFARISVNCTIVVVFHVKVAVLVRS